MTNEITVTYLASLAEKLGKQTETITATETLTVAAIWAALNPAVNMPANTVCAVNFQYAAIDTVVNAGDELAFFPPVTGG